MLLIYFEEILDLPGERVDTRESKLFLETLLLSNCDESAALPLLALQEIQV